MKTHCIFEICATRTEIAKGRLLWYANVYRCNIIFITTHVCNLVIININDILIDLIFDSYDIENGGANLCLNNSEIINLQDYLTISMSC